MRYLTILLVLTFLTPNVSAEVAQATVPKVEVSKPLTLHEKIEATFWDEPRMLKVIHCESGTNKPYVFARQFDSHGSPLMSHTSDVGVMQINQVHWAKAKLLGLDIFNSENDNIKMGRIIYDEQGIGAWMCNNKV